MFEVEDRVVLFPLSTGLVTTMLLFANCVGMGTPLAATSFLDDGYKAQMRVPLDNSSTRDKEGLGKLLFNDKRLSSDGTVSCASCHDPENAFAGSERVSRGVYGRKTFRNAPSLLDVGYFTVLTWDGRVESLEAQAVYPLTGSNEMGASIPLLLQQLSRDPNYRDKFEGAFGVQQITLDRVVKALATYQRTLVSSLSLFERYYVSGIESAISEQAKRGWRTFKQHCLECHHYDNNNRFFSDFRYRNTGVSSEDRIRDLGRFYYSLEISDQGRFRTPSLRNISNTAPYMHDGSLSTLSDVIEYYRYGISEQLFLDIDSRGIVITDNDKLALLAFLEMI